MGKVGSSRVRKCFDVSSGFWVINELNVVVLLAPKDIDD